MYINSTKIAKNFRISFFPILILILSAMLSIFPFKSNLLHCVTPLFVYIPLYFWTINRPTSFSYLSLFILGIFKDMVDNTVTGINAICFLIFYFIAKSSRKHILNYGFTFIWIGFISCLTLIMLVLYLLILLNYNDNIYSFYFAFKQWFIISLSYIPFHFLFTKEINTTGYE